MRTTPPLRRARALALGLLALAACRDAPSARPPVPPPDSALSAVDDAGRTVRLPHPARRVVSLLPAGTEALLALGAGDRLVGRTRYDTEPGVAGLPSVGGGLDPSLEALAALRPELVIAFETSAGSRIRPRIEALGIPVYAAAPRDTASILGDLRDLGHLVGRDAAADSLLRRIHAQLDSVRARVPPGPRPRVLYAVSIDPPIVAGTDYIAELLRVAGGEPVRVEAAGAGISPIVSLEALVRLQPDVVLLPVDEGDRGERVARLREEPGWRDLRAVEEGRVVTVPADLVHRPGPRIGEIAGLLRDALDGVRAR